MCNDFDLVGTVNQTAIVGGGNSNISLTGSSSLSYPGKPGYKPSLYI